MELVERSQPQETEQGKTDPGESKTKSSEHDPGYHERSGDGVKFFVHHDFPQNFGHLSAGSGGIKLNGFLAAIAGLLRIQVRVPLHDRPR